MTKSRLPPWVNVCAIGYRVQESEGLIVFTESDPMWGRITRVWFERDGDGACWYVSFSDPRSHVMVSHVVKMYELVCEAHGKNHEVRKA